MATLRPLESQYGLSIGGSLVIDRERNLAVENASIKNLTVTGTVTAVNSTDTFIKDSNILLNSGIEAGSITTLGTLTGGSNYTAGLYKNVLLTIVSGTAGIGATADITVNSSGAVSAVTIVNSGFGYATNTVFSATSADLDSDTTPNGTGFQITVTAVGAGSASTDASITVGRGTTGTDVSLKWNETTDKWQLTNDGTTFGNLVSTADSGTVTNTMLSGGISAGKLSLTSASIIVGNGSNVGAEVALSGDATLANTGALTIANSAVTFAKFQSSVAAGLSVVGRSANSAGVFAEINAGTDGHVLRRSGTTLAFGEIATAGIANSAVTYAKIQNVSATDRLLGRSSAGAGVVEEITCTATGRSTIALNATQGGILYGASGSTAAYTAAGTTGQVLISNGTGAPTFQTMNLGNLDTWTKPIVKAATTADLGTVTYANGTAGVGATLTGPTGASAVVFPTQDGVTINLNDRILVKNQTTGLQNGIYTLTTVGVAGTTAWVLTRATDSDTAADMAASVVGVADGAANGGLTYDTDFKSTDTVGTTTVSYYRVLDSVAISTSALLAGLISDETGSGSLVFANTPTLVSPILGTPTSGTLTNCTGLPVAGISNLGANVGAFLITPSSANLAAALTDKTGTGVNVFATSPTLVTPTLGVASATSINKVTITAPATSATLTIADGKTLTASNTLTFTGTDASSVAFGAGGTVAYTGNKLSVFAATTSTELAGVISDETGSGSLVFANTPTLTTPRIASASHIADSNGNELILFPAAVGSAVNEITVSNAATGVSPSISASGGDANVNLSLSSKGTGRVTVGSTGLGIRDTSAAFDVTLVATSSTALAANRQLTVDVVNAARTLKLNGNLDLGANFTTTTGAITLVGQSGGSNVTLPTSGTVAVLTDATNVGTTPIALNRASAEQSLTGITGFSTTATAVTSTNSTAISIATGNATGATSNSGAVTIDTGTATGTTGAITIGGTNASTITLGKAQTRVNIGADAALSTRSTSTSVATATVVDSFALATFRSCEYLVQITQGSSHQITKILLVHDGTTAFITEYGTVVTSGSSPIAPLDAVINGANIELQVTTGNTNAHTIKVTRTAMIV